MAVKVKESIGEQIKTLIKKQPSLGWLAERIGISQGQLSKKIHGSKSWKQDELDIINKALGTSFKL